MKLKTLEGHLGSVRGFVKPKIEYEQYETPAHIAAVSLYSIQVRLTYRTIYHDIINTTGICLVILR